MRRLSRLEGELAVIEIPCPHCQRVLKVPEKYVGTEGACNYCGARVHVAIKQQAEAAIVTVSPPAAAPALDVPAELQDQLADARTEIDALSEVLEGERAQREKAESDRDAALARVADLEAAIEQAAEREAAPRAELDRVTHELALSREQAESLGRELEAKRADIRRAESRLADVRTRLTVIVDDLSDAPLEAPVSVAVTAPPIIEADAAAILVGGGANKRGRWARLLGRQ